MLPERLLRCSVRDGRLTPHFLGEADHPWLRALAEEVDRYAGRRRRELAERLREPLGWGARPGPQALAVHVLAPLWQGGARPGLPATRARATLFVEAARRDGGPRTRDAILAAAAGTLGVTPAALEESLFADLPDERLVRPLDPPPPPEALALRVNHALAQGLLARAALVRIEAEGNARALVRHARLRGLICTVAPGPSSPAPPGSRPSAPGRAGSVVPIAPAPTPTASSAGGAGGGGAAGDAAMLTLSGPLALFRRTLLYGRAMAELLPLLAWCRRFLLHAHCVVRGESARLALGTGAPIFPSAPPRAYDSRLEERFARDFRRLAPDWDVLREPEPVPAAGTLVFPDFAIEHRADRARRWLVEIVGFWTPDYLARKLARYRAARLDHLILCVDEARDCADGDFPQGARIVRFRRRVDAAAVLRIVTYGPEGVRPGPARNVP